MKKKFKQSLKALAVMLVVVGMLLMPLSAFAEGDGDGSGVEALGDPGEPANEGGGDGGNADSGSNHGDVGDIGDGDSNAADNGDGDEVGDSSGRTDNEGSNSQDSDNKGSGGSDFGDNNADNTNNDNHANQDTAADPEIAEEDEKFDGNTYSVVVECENFKEPGNPLILNELGWFTLTFTEIGKSRIGSVRVTVPEGFKVDIDSLKWKFDFSKTDDQKEPFDPSAWEGKFEDERTLSLWAIATEYYLYLGQSLIVNFVAQAPDQIVDDVEGIERWKWNEKHIGVYEFKTEAWTNATDGDGKPLLAFKDGMTDRPKGKSVGTANRVNQRSDDYSQRKVWVGDEKFKDEWGNYKELYDEWFRGHSTGDYIVVQKPSIDDSNADLGEYDVRLDILGGEEKKETIFNFHVSFKHLKEKMTRLEIYLPKGVRVKSFEDVFKYDQEEHKLIWDFENHSWRESVKIHAYVDGPNAGKVFHTKGFHKEELLLKRNPPPEYPRCPSNLRYPDLFSYEAFMAGQRPIDNIVYRIDELLDAVIIDEDENGEENGNGNENGGDNGEGENGDGEVGDDGIESTPRPTPTPGSFGFDFVYPFTPFTPRPVATEEAPAPAARTLALAPEAPQAGLGFYLVISPDAPESDLVPLVGVPFVEEGTQEDLDEAIAAYEALLEFFEANHEEMTDEEYAKHLLDLSAAWAAIQLRLAVLAEEVGEEYDLETVHEAAALALEHFEAHGEHLNEEQEAAFTAVMEAVEQMLGILAGEEEEAA